MSSMWSSKDDYEFLIEFDLKVNFTIYVTFPFYD